MKLFIIMVQIALIVGLLAGIIDYVLPTWHLSIGISFIGGYIAAKIYRMHE